MLLHEVKVLHGSTDLCCYVLKCIAWLNWSILLCAVKELHDSTGLCFSHAVKELHDSTDLCFSHAVNEFIVQLIYVVTCCK